jgi:hypothetical protein
MRQRTALALLLALGFGIAVSLLGGCSLKGTLKPGVPPQTTIFIEGPVDTVNHIVHLHWYGTEPNGYIAGYEVRLLNPEAPADSNWVFTTLTDTILTVLTPNGFTRAVFEARAIDDKGVKDPDPARQTFDFSNKPPILKLVDKPNIGDHSDTTFASATVTWTVDDPDGDASKVIARIWLNGNESAPDIAPGNSFTVPSSRFLIGGAYTSGKRTLFIQGVDDGGMAGPIDSVSWYVRQPVAGTRARLLLIDDVLSTDAAKTRVDSLYRNAVINTGIASDSWSVLRLQFNKPWRSEKDMEQTFKLFETVVWYRGEQSSFSSVLASYGEGIGPYLDSGGKMFLESLNLISTPSNFGALSLDFADRYMDSDGVFQFPQAPDSSAAWGLSGTGTFYIPTLAESLLNRRIISGMRAFQVRNAAEALFVAPAHTLSQDNPIEMPVAINVSHANGGRFIVDTYPMVSATISVPGFPQRASIVLLKTFGLLGLSGP